MRLMIDLQKSILRQVFGFDRITQKALRRPERGFLMALDETFKCFNIAATHQRDEVFIGGEGVWDRKCCVLFGHLTDAVR